MVADASIRLEVTKWYILLEFEYWCTWSLPLRYTLIYVYIYLYLNQELDPCLMTEGIQIIITNHIHFWACYFMWQHLHLGLLCCMTSVSLYNIQTPQEICLPHGLVSPRQSSCKILLVNFFSPGISFYLCVHVGGNTEKFALYLVNWFQSNLRGQLTISLQIQIIFFLNEFYFFLNPIIFVRTGTTCMSHANGAGSGYVKFVLPISETASQFPFRGNKHTNVIRRVSAQM